jgi:transcription termination factor 2
MYFVIRMSNERIPKQLFFGELVEGHRKQGRPRKRYKDNLKDNLKWCEVKPKELQQVAQDRTQWRNTFDIYFPSESYFT